MAYSLAALSGVLYVLGYPGCGFWPLSFVALLPVLRAVERVRTFKQALAVGVVFGMSMQLLGAYWLVGTLRDFGRLPLPLSILGYVLVCLVQSGQLVAFVMLSFAIQRRDRDPVVFAPLCLGAAELACPQLFSNYFAASLQPAPLLLQCADLGGPTLVSMLLAACNAGLYRLVWPRDARSSTRWRVPALIAALWACAIGYGVLRMAQVDAASAAAPKLSVAIVQANLPPFQKIGDRERFRQRHIELSKQIEQTHKPELLIWPETALQFVLPLEIKDVRALLAPLATPVLFGGLGHEVANGHARLYNSAFLADAGGHVRGRTDKQRLIPFAEYIPFGEYAPRLYDLLPNTGAFTPAVAPHALPFREHRIAVLICYEDVLPEHVRDVVRQTQPDLLVNLSNDVWFGRSPELVLHHAFAALRAVEHRRYLVRADNVGISAVVDAVGRVIAQSKPSTQQNLYADVALLGQDTLYDHVGQLPASLGLLALLVALMPLRAARRRARAPN